MKLYRELTAEEEARFRAHIRATYKPFDPIDGCWHPVVIRECADINAKAQLPFEFLE